MESPRLRIQVFELGLIMMAAGPGDGLCKRKLGGGVVGPASFAVNEKEILLMVLRVHENRAAVAAYKINRVGPGAKNRGCTHDVADARRLYNSQGASGTVHGHSKNCRSPQAGGFWIRCGDFVIGDLITHSHSAKFPVHGNGKVAKGALCRLTCRGSSGAKIGSRAVG
jgi:hypothetical protein